MKCEFATQHSPFVKKIILGFLMGFVLICGLATQSKAQMFSVGRGGPRFDVPQSEFYIGLEPLTSTYKGPIIADASYKAFDFSGPVLRIGYNTPGVDIFLGTGGKITGINDVAYFDFGGHIDFGLNLYRSKKLSLQIPARLSSRFTNMTNDKLVQAIADRFQFGYLAGGLGLRLVGRPAPNFRIRIGAVPSYGFAFASQGTNSGGSLGSVAASSRFYFDRLFGDVGLSVGYKYDLRNYDISEDIYDYKISGHNITVGFTF